MTNSGGFMPTGSGLVPPENLAFHSLFSAVEDFKSLQSATSWHARIVTSLELSSAHALPRIAYCDAAVVPTKHDPWAGLYKRPVGLTAIKTLTSPSNMGLTVARNMGLAFLGLAHKHITLLTEAEEKAIETNSEPEHVPFPWDDLPAVLKRGGFNSCMDLTVLSTRGVLDWLAADLLLPDRCSVETLVRMHTDMRRTSRALAPAYPMMQRFARVTKTALWSEITLYMSEWLVTSVLDAVRLVTEGKDRFVERILLKVAVNCARCASLWMAVSVGNGLGASSPKMRPLTMLVGANAAALVVNLYWRLACARIEARAFGDDDDGDQKKMCENKGDASSADNAGDEGDQRPGVEGSSDEDDDCGDDNDAEGSSLLPAAPSISPTGIPRAPDRLETCASPVMKTDEPGNHAGLPAGPSGIPRLPVRKRKPPRD